MRNVVIWMLMFTFAGLGQAQMLRCIPDSPERHGQPGCSVIGDKRLPSIPTQPVMWHIDKFTSLSAAEKGSGPNSIAFEAHGPAWLCTVESDVSNHHGGQHVAAVGPLPVQPNRPYSMQVMSAYFLPGNFSIVHTHSGPEAWWVLQGEQCLETTKTTIRAHAGQSAIVPEGEIMRLIATGNSPRRSLVLILHDAEKPATTVVQNPPALKSCQ